MTESQTAQTAAPSVASTEFENAVYRKVMWHLLPFLMLCYVVAYLDRMNVGFAKLQMLSDLRFSETAFGLGAGMFFVGYFIFEIPSNIIMHKIGARLWLPRIMITWGIISACTVFVNTPMQFYIVRVLLGLAEAGFFPGIILYLTYWFPSHRRARMVAMFMVAIPMSGIIGGPLSGFVMHYFAGTLGWAGWKWMFLIEAVPALIMGIAILLYLDNGIRQAKWLTEEEKLLLERNVAKETSSKKEHPSLRALFSDGRVWLMCWIFFAHGIGQTALAFWLPTFIKAAGIQSVLNIGLVTAIPYIATVIAMVLLGSSADRHRERRWHLAAPMMVGAVALVLSMQIGSSHTVLAVICLTIATAGVIGAVPVFWSFPTAFLAGTAAAAGIATVNSVGSLCGFAGPYMVGFLRDLTHSNQAATYVLAFILIAGALTALSVPAKMVNK